MNKIKSYIIGAVAMLALGGGLTSCQDNFDAPDLGQGPVATMQPNTTIAEVKEWLWNTELNYCDTVFTRDYFTGQTTEKWDGEHVIISGRVISSDYAGNCFKYIILQDETGALSFSINSYNLYLEYRRGQEVVVDLTGLFAGKYRGLFQIGFPSWNSSSNGYETSFLAPEMFTRQRELNGMPQIAAIDTLEIASFSELGTAPSDLRQWQSQLIRINNVTFSQSSEAAAEGITTLSTYHSSGVSQTITDSEGQTGAVRTSGYANFWNMELPEGPVDVVLIASYYGSNESNAAWQFTLIDANGIITDPTVPKGSKDNPYGIEEAILLQSDPSKTVTAWVEGYLVGTVEAEVTEVKDNTDIDWTDEPILGNTMVLGPTADCKDVTKCIVIQLPQGSAIYKQSILAKPSNYHKLIAVKGDFVPVMETFGVVTPGSTNDYLIEGQSDNIVGDGSEDNPYTCVQVIKMAPSSTTDAVESGVWMSGYIVGYYNDYAGHFETAGAVKTNILMSDNPSAADVSQCVSVQLPVGSVRDALNIADTPALLGRMVAVYGDVMKYNTLPGIKNTSKYALGDFSGGGSDTPSGDVIFSETFGSSQGAFTIENTTLPSGLTYVWNFASGYGMKASAYANNTNYAADSWLISPAINLAGATSPVLSFDHVVNFFSNLDTAKKEVSVSVRVGTGSWTALTIPTWSTNSDWTFVNSGNIDLSAYNGQTIQLGFRYTSTATKAGTWEVKNVKITEGTPSSGGNTGGGSDVPGTGAGSESDPYSVEAVIAMGTGVETTGYVKGYIVGNAPSATYSEAIFTAAGASASNVLLASSPSCKDYNQCIPVQLVSGTDIRKQLNLVDNPGNIGKEVLICGTITKYFNVPGIKSPTSAVFTNGSGGNTGGGDTPAAPTGVITVAEALNLISNGYKGSAQVKGIITNIEEVSTQYGNATYTIKDSAADADGLKIFRGYWLNGEKFTSATQLEVGAEVIVEGTIENYMGNTPEMSTGGKIISYNGQTGGNTGGNDNPGGNTPGAGSSTDTETFTQGIGLPDGSAEVPTSAKTYTSTTTGIKYEIMGCYTNSGYLMLNGKNYEGAYISWSLDFACTSLEMTTSSGCSTNAASTVNVYANGNLIASEYKVNEQNKTYTIEIPAEYQAAGTVYKVESGTTKYNQQFVSFKYVK